MTDAHVYLAVENPDYTVKWLADTGIEARVNTDQSIEVSLDIGRGDQVFKKADGGVRIVQDAMVETLGHAEIIEVS